jgi:pyruvate/2-oxoglutarate dehydrogenase complex dihydrolipoamide acyltransferase (E2) component
MQIRVKLPQLGDTTQEVLITEWLCDVGDDVELGTVLMMVETDKAVAEVPSPVAGRLVEQLVSVDDEISVGTQICVIESRDS